VSYLAVGLVTKAIAELLSKKLNNPPLMGLDAHGTPLKFRVTTLPPDDNRVNDETGLNLFLYRIHENPITKNMDWRGDKLNPVQNGKPPLSLTLTYLLTAYINKVGGTVQDDITTQQLMGNAMSVLHDYPVLNNIHDSDFDASLDSQFPAELRNSFEKIKVMLLPTSMEEFSKIWTGLNKPYRLSVAYEVSLAEIRPLLPPAPPPPTVQQTALAVSTIGTPVIISITPASGTASVTITIQGSRLKQAGGPTTVQVGDDVFTGDQLTSISETQIQLTTPAAPQTGPRLPVVVTAAGRSSQPAFYTVAPWIATLAPLRGITGIPITIPIALPPAAAVQVTIDGNAAAVTLDPQGKFVTAVVPTAIAANGPKPVVLTLNGQRSNTRILEVLPLITNATVTSSASPPPGSTTLTIDGERLDGQEVDVNIGGLLVKGGANANAAQVAVTVQRVLPITAPVTVIVDGTESNPIPSRVDSILPPAVFAGDAVVLNGAGLSGRHVIVSFSAANVDLGAQPFATRIRLNTPRALAAGQVQVSVSVDGRLTNQIALEVLG
jgi:hypothetical protein